MHSVGVVDRTRARHARMFATSFFLRLATAWAPLVLLLLAWRALEAPTIELRLAPEAIVAEHGHLRSTPLRASVHRVGPSSAWTAWRDRVVESARRLFFADGGDWGSRSDSTLVLLADGVALGPAHAAHESIAREGGGRYSHWGRRLFFSLPAGSRAAPDLVAIWTAPLRGWVVALLALAGVAATVSGWRGTARLLHASMPPRRARRRLAAVALTIAAATAPILLAGGAAAAIAWWLPPVIVVATLIAGTASSCAALLRRAARSHRRARGADADVRPRGFPPSSFERVGRRMVEVVLLPLCVLVACTSAVAMRAGSQPDALPGSGFTIAGVLPLSDAANYAAGAEAIVDGAPLNSVAARRPVLATSHAALLALGRTWDGFVWAQALLLAAGVGAMGLVLVRRLGPWAALGAAITVVAWMQGTIATVMSEPLGAALAAAGVVFLLLGADRRSVSLGLTGLFAVSLSSLVRPGAMLALPLIAAAVVLNAPRGQRRGALFGAVGTLAAAAILPTVIAFGVGSFGGAVNANLSHTLLGLAAGTNWHEADERFADELAALPDERAQSEWRMAKAWELMRAEPAIFAGSLWRGLAAGVVEIPESAWRWSRAAVVRASAWGAPLPIGDIPSPLGNAPLRWAGAALWVAAALLAVLAIVRGRRDPFMLILGAWTIGVLVSLPIIWTDGGWRSLAGSAPLFAILLMLPAWAPRARAAHATEGAHPQRIAAGGRGAAALAAATLAVVPAGIVVAIAARVMSGGAVASAAHTDPTWTITLGPRTVWLDGGRATAAPWPEVCFPVRDALRADPTLAVVHLVEPETGRHAPALAPRAWFDSAPGRYRIELRAFEPGPEPWCRAVSITRVGAATSTDAPP